MSKHVLLRAFAVFAGIVALFTVGFGSASAATGPGGFTILYASHGDEAHHCTSIGNDGTTEGIICADIVTSSTSGSFPYYSSGQVEAYCQTISSGAVVQCANINEVVGIFDPARHVVLGSRFCGHTDGACPVGRVDESTGSGLSNGDFYWTSDTGCDTNPDSSYVNWSEVLGTGETTIELPHSDKTLALDPGAGANDGDDYSSGHYYVCL